MVFDEQNFPAKDQASSHFPSKISAIGDAPFILPVSLLPNFFSGYPNSPFLPYSTSPISSNANGSPASTSHSESALPNAPTVPSPALLSHPSPEMQLSIPVLGNPIPAPPSLHPMNTRSRIGSTRPKQFPNFKLYKATKYPPQLFHLTISATEPSCYRKAASNHRWVQAMTEEFQALQNNGTWTLCPCPPH